MKRFVGMLSPSMVVACIALLVALGGAGMAATGLPLNSVGNRQLKADAVTSSKVKDRSLHKVDFGTGELPAGPQGPAGPKGEKGDRGSKGDKGAKGDIGPSDAFTDFNAGPATVGPAGYTRIATLRLPQPGNYVIWSKVWLIRPTAGQATESVCKLSVDGVEDVSWFTAPTGLGQSTTNILTHEVTSVSTVNLNCYATGESTASDARITAIKVGSVTTSSG
jgi:hypothetical protein